MISTLLSVASACTDDGDCGYNGACHMSDCACAVGWTGSSCESLDFSAASTASARLWPVRHDIDAAAASAWGFSVPLFDTSDGLYHSWATVACGGDGVIGDGGGNSFIAHLTSASAPAAGGAWSLRAAFTPATTFGPHSTRARDGTIVVIFRVNVLLNDSAACAGNGSAPLPPAFLAASEVPAASLASGDPEVGTSIYVASAARAAGPWSVARINITGAGSLHKSNPSIAQLPDGRWALAYRYNPRGGSLNALALADDFRGPYACVANVTAGQPGDEDPFFWATNVTAGDPPAPAPQLMGHMLFHNRDFGHHAFGPLDGSAPWRVSPGHAFSLNVSMDDGSTTRLARRERPALRFDATSGRPVALINGVQNTSATGACFSFEQPIAGA
jgi:hypothetical protein